MFVQQWGLLGLEAVVMAAILLGLFRARTTLGLTPLYVVLGGFQFLEATLGLQVGVLPGVPIYPASTILFTATLVTVLLVYVKEDAIEARKLVYGLVLANASVALISLLIFFQLSLPGSTAGALGAGDFLNSARVAVIGTTLLFLDVIGIIVLYEYVSRFFSSLFLRFYLSLVVIAAFDNTLFVLALNWDKANVGTLLIAGAIGKWTAALLYTIIYDAYLRYVDPPTAVVGTGIVADTFQLLTYRQKYEQVRERMVRDALTGLFNRGYLDESLPQALAHAQRYHEPLSLLVIDTDHFKSINDRFSHLEGDRVLRTIAETLASLARSADIPCRYGGDEFVIILRAGADEARAFAERLRAGLKARCAQQSPPQLWSRVTTTIGIASYPDDPGIATAEDMLRVADARLYEGKHSGRDRVVTPGEREQLLAGMRDRLDPEPAPRRRAEDAVPP
jgi:diguanylate cyclase (GGDEF)-like protein